MSRVFFTPQAGRQGKSGVKNEEEWGRTTSQSEFRGYEPAEMRNCRDAPRHAKSCVESSNRGTLPKGQSQRHEWHRTKESFPDHSAYTATVQSQGSRPYKPDWAVVADKPLRNEKFDHVTHYSHHQQDAQQARHGYFPYRDEFAPRSKRLLYELAHQRCSRDSVASGSTESASAYTMSRSAASRSGTGRSRSEGSLAASSHHTADSRRLDCGLAKRRAQCQFRSPSLWPADAKWFQETWEKDGPCGMTFGNFRPGHYTRNCKGEVEQGKAINALLSGISRQEEEAIAK